MENLCTLVVDNTFDMQRRSSLAILEGGGERMSAPVKNQTTKWHRRGREHTEDAHRRTPERLTEPFVHSRHSSAIDAIISLASFPPHFKNINVALRLLSELHRRVLLSLKPAGSHCQPCTAATFNKRANLPDSFQRRWLAKHHIGSLIPPPPPPPEMGCTRTAQSAHAPTMRQPETSRRATNLSGGCRGPQIIHNASPVGVASASGSPLL